MWLFLNLFLFAACSCLHRHIIMYIFICSYSHTKMFFSYFNSLQGPNSSRVEHSLIHLCARQCQQRARNENFEYFFVLSSLAFLLSAACRNWSQKICVTDFYYGSRRMCVRFLNFDSSARVFLLRTKWLEKNKRRLSTPHSLNSQLIYCESEISFFQFWRNVSQQREAMKTIWLTDSGRYCHANSAQIVRYGCSSNFFQKNVDARLISEIECGLTEIKIICGVWLKFLERILKNCLNFWRVDDMFLKIILKVNNWFGILLKIFFSRTLYKNLNISSFIPPFNNSTLHLQQNHLRRTQTV